MKDLLSIYNAHKLSDKADVPYHKVAEAKRHESGRNLTSKERQSLIDAINESHKEIIKILTDGQAL